MTERIISAKFVHPEVSEFVEPMTNLYQGLQEEIKNGVYSVVVGEGNSSRIPTLVIWRRIDREHTLKGEVEIPAIILDVDYEERKHHSPESLRAQFPEVFTGRKTSRRALLITEYIQSGKKMARLKSWLEELGFEVDACAIFAAHDPDFYDGALLIGQKVERLEGMDYYVYPRICGKYELMGMDDTTGRPIDGKSALAALPVSTRKDLDLLIDLLV